MFFAATIILTASPGPSALLALSHGSRYGFRRTAATVAGSLTAFTLLLIISLLGVGALLATSSKAFHVLKIIGAIYLIYVGVKTWIAAGKVTVSEGRDNKHLNGTWRRFTKGFAIALSNPKVLIFFATYFPQFIKPAGNYISQILILGRTFLALECAWQGLYASAGGVHWGVNNSTRLYHSPWSARHPFVIF